MLDTIEWAGTAFQISGAIALASRYTAPRTAYAMMLAGSGLWLAAAACVHNWPLVTMQSTFAAINVVGLVRWKGIAA